MIALNDNINMKDEGDEIIDQEVQGKEPVLARSERIVKKPVYLKH
jgi:hypothetical protein